MNKKFVLKILVTGGAGYIGSHTIIELLELTDFEVVSIDNYINSSAKTYERINEVVKRKFDFYEVDLKNLVDLKAIFKKHKFDGIIHFAALKSAPESIDKSLEYYFNNIYSLMNLLECQKVFGVPHLIFSSSCTVYGNVNELPVNELTPVGHSESPYGSTKKIGEEIIENVVNNLVNSSAISLRYFNPVGAHISGLIGEDSPSPSKNLFPLITQAAIDKNKVLSVFGSDYNTRDGTCIRDFIHVSDIAVAHVLALKYLHSKKNTLLHEVFNLGSGVGYTILEVIKEFEKATKIKIKYKLTDRREGDVISIYSDNKKAIKKLGWKINYDLNSMLKSAWNWEQFLNKNTEY